MEQAIVDFLKDAESIHEDYNALGFKDIGGYLRRVHEEYRYLFDPNSSYYNQLTDKIIEQLSDKIMDSVLNEKENHSYAHYDVDIEYEHAIERLRDNLIDFYHENAIEYMPSEVVVPETNNRVRFNVSNQLFNPILIADYVSNDGSISDDNLRTYMEEDLKATRLLTVLDIVNNNLDTFEDLQTAGVKIDDSDIQSNNEHNLKDAIDRARGQLEILSNLFEELLEETSLAYTIMDEEMRDVNFMADEYWSNYR